MHGPDTGTVAHSVPVHVYGDKIAIVHRRPKEFVITIESRPFADAVRAMFALIQCSRMLFCCEVSMKAPRGNSRTPSPPPDDFPEAHVERLQQTPEIAARLSRALGPFGASVSLICVNSFLSLEFARSDIAAKVIGAIAGVAISALCFHAILALWFRRDEKISTGPEF